jgi:hypothetical protein
MATIQIYVISYIPYLTLALSHVSSVYSYEPALLLARPHLIAVSQRD